MRPSQLLVAVSLLFSSHAFALYDDIYAYNYWIPEHIRKYSEEIYKSGKIDQLNDDKIMKCAPVYKNAVAKGVLEIRYALGYFDDSTGVDISWEGKNFGYSPSLDIGVYNGIKQALTQECKDPSMLNLCGFQVASEGLGKSVLEKNVMVLGKDMLVRMTLTHASASEYFLLNKGELAERQKFLTLQSEENYFGGIGNADIVIYNGHSRDGGGPDFNPPILDKSLHTNYSGYYHKVRPGIKRVLELIKKSPNKDGVLTFFSCYSKKHFYNDLLAANPKQRLVLSADTIDYFDSLKASIGYLEGFMRGSCGQDLADIAKQGEKLMDGFQGFQIR